MKTLVSLACVAIIAAVGYHFWGEWQRHQQASAEAAATREALVLECKATAADLAVAQNGRSLGRRFIQGDAQEALRRCVANGLIGLDELGEATI